MAIQAIMIGVSIWAHHNPKKDRVRIKFLRWYNRQMDGWWINVLPKSPKNITVIGGNPSYNESDKDKWEKPEYKEPGSAEERLHPGIKFSMRSKVYEGHTNQATYDASGKLHTKEPMAGTVDWRAPLGSNGGGLGLAHYKADVRPLHWAVYLDHGIEMHLFWGPKVPTGPKAIGTYMKKYYAVRPLY